MIKIKMIFSIMLLISFLTGSHYVIAEDLIWEYSAKAAFYKAISEKKKIVLFVGRDTCENCKYMRTQVFVTEKPPVKKMLEDHYVLWFSDADKSNEWYRTALDLEDIPLPLICIIDPEKSSKAYEDRTTGKQHSPDFYSRLLKYVEGQDDKSSPLKK